MFQGMMYTAPIAADPSGADGPLVAWAFALVVCAIVGLAGDAFRPWRKGVPTGRISPAERAPARKRDARGRFVKG